MITALRVFGTTRALYGAWLLSHPVKGGTSWLGPASTTPAGRSLLISVGARDLLIGAAIAAGPAPAAATIGAVLADVADLVGTVGARQAVPSRTLGKAVAVMLVNGGIGAALVLLARRRKA